MQNEWSYHCYALSVCRTKICWILSLILPRPGSSKCRLVSVVSEKLRREEAAEAVVVLFLFVSSLFCMLSASLNVILRPVHAGRNHMIINIGNSCCRMCFLSYTAMPIVSCWIDSVSLRMFSDARRTGHPLKKLVKRTQVPQEFRGLHARRVHGCGSSRPKVWVFPAFFEMMCRSPIWAKRATFVALWVRRSEIASDKCRNKQSGVHLHSVVVEVLQPCASHADRRAAISASSKPFLHAWMWKRIK